MIKTRVRNLRILKGMINIIQCFTISFLFLFSSLSLGQVVQEDELEFFDLPNNLIQVQFFVTKVDSSIASDYLGCVTEQNYFKKISYCFKEDTTLSFTFSWYEFDNNVFVNKYDYLLLRDLIDAKWKKIPYNLIEEQIYHSVKGIKKIIFQEVQTGVYKDKFYHQKKTPFQLRFLAVYDFKGSPGWYRDERNKYVNINSNDLVSYDTHFMLVFCSDVLEIPSKLNQSRKIYFSLHDCRIRSSEIESRYDDSLFH